MPLKGLGKRRLAVLAQERRVKLGVEHEGAAAKRRFRAELLEDQLLDGIVENSEARADAGLAGATKQLAKDSILGVRTPGHADARRK
jgi:hypothetical protein